MPCYGRHGASPRHCDGHTRVRRDHGTVLEGAQSTSHRGERVVETVLPLAERVLVWWPSMATTTLRATGVVNIDTRP
jgi:hypothetical protein